MSTDKGRISGILGTLLLDFSVVFLLLVVFAAIRLYRPSFWPETASVHAPAPSATSAQSPRGGGYGDIVPFLAFFGSVFILGRIATVVHQSYRDQVGRPGGPSRAITALETWRAYLANQEPPQSAPSPRRP